MSSFSRIAAPENLHDTVTRTLALQVIQAERASDHLVFPNEAGLCQQLGISRSILREAVKVLADKGMIEVRPRSGTRSRPRSDWNLLDPDILAWQSELKPDARFLRDLCEVRLAIEPTASGFAALRATPEEVAGIERCVEQRDAATSEEAIELELRFYTAVVEASHNTLFRQLMATIRQPLRVALSYTAGLPASYTLGMQAYRALAEAIRRHDPLAARAASDEIVGIAMLAVEQVVRMMESRR
jgi:DNA-binding FadR family transcriptional regulator